jgi:hypothetical protein
MVLGDEGWFEDAEDAEDAGDGEASLTAVEAVEGRCEHTVEDGLGALLSSHDQAGRERWVERPFEVDGHRDGLEEIEDIPEVHI